MTSEENLLPATNRQCRVNVFQALSFCYIYQKLPFYNFTISCRSLFDKQLKYDLGYFYFLLSFVLRNSGTVQFEYNWILEAGWTREPTEVQQERSDDRPSAAPSTTPTASTRSTKGSRERTKSPKTIAVDKKTTEIRPATRTATSSVDQSRATATAKEIRPASRLASAVNGRPASAMALAYDAGSVYSEPVGSDLWPFTIEPSSGHIKPQEEAIFTVRFSPLEIHTYGGTLIAK